jgi:hypothetical protein
MHDVANPSLEAVGPSSAVNLATEQSGRPGTSLSCWMEGGYGNNTVHWRRTGHAHTGRWAEQLSMTGYHSGGAELLPLFDLGACSLPVTEGRSYQLSTWYMSTAQTQFSVYYRDAAGRWRYWTSSPYFPPATDWTKATWQPPAIPAGATGLSYGLSLFSRGTLTTDDYGFAVAPPNIARTVLDWGLLAALILIGAIVIGRRITRGPPPDSPQSAGSEPHMTRPQAVSARQAS